MEFRALIVSLLPTVNSESIGNWLSTSIIYQYISAISLESPINCTII